MSPPPRVTDGFSLIHCNFLWKLVATFLRFSRGLFFIVFFFLVFFSYVFDLFFVIFVSLLDLLFCSFSGHGVELRWGAGRSHCGEHGAALVPPRPEPGGCGGIIGQGRERWQLPGARQRERHRGLRPLRPVSILGGLRQMAQRWRRLWRL